MCTGLWLHAGVRALPDRLGRSAGRAPPTARCAGRTCGLHPRPAGQVDRETDWRRLLKGVTRREAVADGIRLSFSPETDVADIARLVHAEQGCCAFFAFALTVDGRGTALEVRAPADAAGAVTTLFGAAS